MDGWWDDDFLFGSQLPTLHVALILCLYVSLSFSPHPSLLWVCMSTFLPHSFLPPFPVSLCLWLGLFLLESVSVLPSFCPSVSFFHFSLTFSSKLLTLSDELCSQLETGSLAHSFFPFSLCPWCSVSLEKKCTNYIEFPFTNVPQSWQKSETSWHQASRSARVFSLLCVRLSPGPAVLNLKFG